MKSFISHNIVPCLACIVLQVPFALSWGYEGAGGPANWYKDYPACNGNLQSPIQLLESNSNLKSFSSFKFNGYDTTSGTDFNIKNNGHTVQVTVPDTTQMTVNAFGKTFKPWQVHFHWGAAGSDGSEHTLKKNQSHLHPGEMHFVHVNTHYANISEALKHYDGLLVFGTILEVGRGSNNPVIDKLIKNFKNITYAETNISFQAFPLKDFLMVDQDKFYHYSGSLTTPPCSQAVQWVVFNHEMSISQQQMAEFRKLHHHEYGSNKTVAYISNNNRPLQNINGRTIYRSFPGSVAAHLFPRSLRISMAAIFTAFFYQIMA